MQVIMPLCHMLSDYDAPETPKPCKHDDKEAHLQHCFKRLLQLLLIGSAANWRVEVRHAIIVPCTLVGGTAFKLTSTITGACSCQTS